MAAPGGLPSAQAMPNGQFMGGNAMGPMGYGGNNYYAPNPLPATPIQGIGRYVSPGAQFISGLEAGTNLMGNLQQTRRGAQMYGAHHQAVMDYARLQGATPAQMNAEQQQFSTMPGTRMLESAGHMLRGLPHDAASAVSAAGSGLVDAYHDVTGMFAGGGIVPASTQGQMPPGWAAGAGTRAFAGGGAVPGPATAAPAPMPMPMPMPMPGLPQGAGGNGAMPAGTQLGGTVGAAGGSTAHGAASVPVPPPAAGVPTPGAEPAPAVAPAPPAQSVAVAAHNPGIIARFEGWAGHLWHGIAHQGVGAKGAIPQQDQNAATSGSLATAGQPHSLTPEWFQQNDQLAMQAAMAAGDAGQDPMQVFNALQNQRTAFLQSHFIRDLSTANAALAANDQKGAERAIRSAYYYIPNGSDITFSKDKNGHLTFLDPMTDKPVTATPTTIGMIAQSAMNPESFGGYINQLRVMQMEAQAKLQTGLGQYWRGRGIWASGHGNELRALAASQRVPYQNALDKANAIRAEMQARTTSLLLRSFGGMNALTQRNVQESVSAAGNILTGPLQAVPANSMSPAAGKVVHSGKTPPWLTNLSADDQNQFVAYTAGMAAAGVPAPQAAQNASLLFKMRGQTHPAKGDTSGYAKTHPGQPVPDVMIEGNSIHVWNGKGWQVFPYNPAGQAVFGPSGPYAQMLVELANGGPTYAAPAGGAPSQSTTGLDASYGSSGSAP